LLACRTDDEVLRYVQEVIETACDEANLVETDKAWDAIHRCLTDGAFEFKSQEPLAMCVLGGKQLQRVDTYIVSLKTPIEVARTAKALETVDEAWIRSRFAGLTAKGYEGPADQDDLEYTLSYFNVVKDFFGRAAAAGRHVIFTVDQ